MISSASATAINHNSQPSAAWGSDLIYLIDLLYKWQREKNDKEQSREGTSLRATRKRPKASVSKCVYTVANVSFKLKTKSQEGHTQFHSTFLSSPTLPPKATPTQSCSSLPFLQTVLLLSSLSHPSALKHHFQRTKPLFHTLKEQPQDSPAAERLLVWSAREQTQHKPCLLNIKAGASLTHFYFYGALTQQTEVANKIHNIKSASIMSYTYKLIKILPTQLTAAAGGQKHTGSGCLLQSKLTSESSSKDFLCRLIAKKGIRWD